MATLFPMGIVVAPRWHATFFRYVRSTQVVKINGMKFLKSVLSLMISKTHRWPWWTPFQTTMTVAPRWLRWTEEMPIMDPFKVTVAIAPSMVTMAPSSGHPGGGYLERDSDSRPGTWGFTALGTSSQTLILSQFEIKINIIGAAKSYKVLKRKISRISLSRISVLCLENKLILMKLGASKI